MEELKLNDINKGINITRKALSNIQSDIEKWEDKCFEEKYFNNESEKDFTVFLMNSRTEKTYELDSLKKLKTIREELGRYGEKKVNNSIKNYCDYFDIYFNPRVIFFDVLNSSAGIDGWMRYYEEPL